MSIHPTKSINGVWLETFFPVKSRHDVITISRALSIFSGRIKCASERENEMHFGEKNKGEMKHCKGIEAIVLLPVDY